MPSIATSGRTERPHATADRPWRTAQLPSQLSIGDRQPAAEAVPRLVFRLQDGYCQQDREKYYSAATTTIHQLPAADPAIPAVRRCCARPHVAQVACTAAAPRAQGTVRLAYKSAPSRLSQTIFSALSETSAVQPRGTGGLLASKGDSNMPAIYWKMTANRSPRNLRTCWNDLAKSGRPR